jgi:hypothetical protein
MYVLKTLFDFVQDMKSKELNQYIYLNFLFLSCDEIVEKITFHFDKNLIYLLAINNKTGRSFVYDLLYFNCVYNVGNETDGNSI